ncbi:invasin domain 3-containing protein [Arsenophonus endosymbiont of Aleurodicus floccissimus]|uniref:invasin domain 3-containing protein n=1 Tax=Arsenophonus endosymbiont of Aleurodicus floccissimus TaxID=2152761 RepID=UPI000E6B356A|nr:invasin domain 3-containing protein [Arsenophonus endosymbiont of Aleurodicus floccissimus]
MENGNYKNGTLKFSSDRNSAQIAKLNVTKDKALADDKEKNMLYALVTIQNGNTVENIAVNLTATDGAVIENGTTANTNQRGELIFGVTSTKAGSSEVTAEINGSQKTQSVAFVTAHPSAEKSLLTVQPAKIVANGKTAANLKLELEDAQGNPISGDKVDFTTSLTNSQIKNTKEVGNEVYTAELTGITAGESTIGVKINGSVLKNKTAKVVLTADSDNPSPTKSKLEAKPDNIMADGKAVSTLKLTLQDVNGNLISGQSVKFNTTLANSSATAVTESGPGIYTAPLTGNKACKTEISVEVAGNKLLTVSPVTVILTADSGNVSGEKSKLTAAPSTIVANGVETSTLTLALKDINDNLLGGQQVNFTINLAKSQTSGTKETNEGVYSATLTGTQVGEAVIGVEVNGPVLSVSPVVVTLTADSSKPGADKSTLEANPTRIVADGSAFLTVKLILQDVNGNAISGLKDKVKFSTTLINSKIGDTVEENNGVYTAKLTGTTAGETTFGVKVKDQPLIVSQVVKVTLSADDSKPSADKSILAANPSSIVADGKISSTITLELKDVNGNPLAEQGVVLTPSLSGSEIGKVTEKGNGIYEASLVGTKASQVTISAGVNGKPLVGKTATVTLTADNSKPSKDKSKLEADPTTIVADGQASSTIKLTLLDVNDNLRAGQVVKFKSSLKNSHASDEVKDEGNSIYTATLTGTTAGETSIEVTVNDVVLPVKDAAKVTLTADSSNPSLDESKLTTEPITIVEDGKIARP